MKRNTMLTMLAFVLFFGTKAYAQESELMPFHRIMGYDNSYVLNAMTSSDGELITRAHIRTDDTPTAENLGIMFYKISPTRVEITDSLFVPTNASYRCNLFERDPSGEGFLEVDIDTTETGGFVMRITHFRDSIYPIVPTDEVLVPLFEGVNTNASDNDPFYLKRCMLDSRGDIIVRYPVMQNDTIYDDHIARYGTDGTLKHEAVLEHNLDIPFAIPEYGFECGFGVFSEHPLQYYRCSALEDMYLYLYDSLFQRENYYAFSQYDIPGGSLSYYEFLSNDGPVMIHDGEDVLITTNYIDFPNGLGYPPEEGVAVARYELRTMQRKGLTLINDLPGPYSRTTAKCLQKSSNGFLYLVYREFDWDDVHQTEVSTPLTVAKMDSDLNILWKRYLEMPKDYYVDYLTHPMLSEEGDKALIRVVGRSRFEKREGNVLIHEAGQCYLFLTDDDLLGVEGCEAAVRPYACYPNPVQDLLHLQYSPDVEPKQVKLYDLQGRLVRSQTNALESLNMEGLAAGQYVMKVTMEDGKTFTDKVVKE